MEGAISPMFDQIDQRDQKRYLSIHVTRCEDSRPKLLLDYLHFPALIHAAGEFFPRSSS